MSDSGQYTRKYPPKVCQTCGSEFFKRSTYSRAQWERKRFCSNVCLGISKRATERVEDDGRVKVWTDSGLRWRYHVVMEAKLGRGLRSGEVVDHINGDCTDDRPENLRLFSSHAAHMAAHWAEGTLTKPLGLGGSVVSR